MVTLDPKTVAEFDEARLLRHLSSLASEIQELTDQRNVLIAYAGRFMSCSDARLAEHVAISRTSVSRIRNDPRFSFEALALARDLLKGHAEGETGEVLGVIEGLNISEDKKLAMSVALLHHGAFSEDGS